MHTNEPAKVLDLMRAANEIVDWYDSVATGSTQGGGGVFYADGKATLNGVIVEVMLLERLADALGRTTHPRTKDYRKQQMGQD